MSPRVAAASGETPISAECKKLLETVRQRCPGMLPPAPVGPGTVVAAVTLKADEAAALFPAAAALAAGSDTRDAPVLWREGDRELLVWPTRVTARFALGVIAVTIPVACDQVGEADVHVSFVVGDPNRPAGMLAATDGRPRGPAILVDAWGENLVAFAWHVVVEVATNVAGEAGRDLDGSRLVPIGLSVTPDLVAVVPMARHPFDRARG